MNYRVVSMDSLRKLPKRNLPPSAGSWKLDMDGLLDENKAPNSFVDLAAAQNEYENFQLVLLCQKKPLENVRVEISDLKSGKGKTISANLITMRQVGYVKTTSSWYKSFYHGWWPDPLLDCSGPLNLLPDNKLHLWFTVYVPKNTPAGEYQGTITFAPENDAVTKVPVKLRVWNFAIPEKSNFPFYCLGSHDDLQKFYNLSREDVDPVMQRYMDFVSQYRLIPWIQLKDGFLSKIITLEKDGTFSFDFTFVESYYRSKVKAGIFFDLNFRHNTFTDFHVTDCSSGQTLNIKYEMLSSEYNKMVLTYLGAMGQWLKEKGWYKKCFVYYWDEPYFDVFPQFKKISALVKKALPNIPRMTPTGDSRLVPEIAEDVDIWAPLSSDYARKLDFIKKERAAGKQVWWYVCAMGDESYPNVFIDTEAIKHRLIFWQSWQYRVEAMLYWCFNFWGDNTSPVGVSMPLRKEADELWPNSAWNPAPYVYNGFGLNGDGYFVYPGPGGRPLGSIRLEVIRDGMEDYEYLYLLAEEFRKKKTRLDGKVCAEIERLLKAEKVSKNITDYSLDPNTLLAERRKIGEMIENLKG